MEPSDMKHDIRFTVDRDGKNGHWQLQTDKKLWIDVHRDDAARLLRRRFGGGAGDQVYSELQQSPYLEN